MNSRRHHGIRFLRKNTFPPNYGSPEVLPNQLVLYTASGRLLAAFSFLRLGWTCFALGSLLVAVYAMRRLPDGKMAIGLALVCLPVGALAIVITPPIIGQHYFNRGSIAKAQGHNQEAIANYRKAMKWDAWHAQDIDLYATIGDLQKKSGIENNSPERHISRAVELQQANEYEPAIFELSRAAEAGGVIGAAARRESAKTRIALGLALYQAGGIGGAVTSWQLALADDPTQEVYVLPYLARGYFDLGRYETALQTVDRLIKIIAGHSSMVADVYSLGGDCYAKLGRDADARRYYNSFLREGLDRKLLGDKPAGRRITHANFIDFTQAFTLTCPAMVMGPGPGLRAHARLLCTADLLQPKAAPVSTGFRRCPMDRTSGGCSDSLFQKGSVS